MILATGAYLSPAQYSADGSVELKHFESHIKLECQFTTSSSSLVFDKLYIVSAINKCQMSTHCCETDVRP